MGVNLSSAKSGHVESVGLHLIETAPNHREANAAWLAILVLGVLFRIAVVALTGNQSRAPWSGGGGAPTYALLPQNLLSGKGFTYASQPTALRAPGYPVALAGLMWLVGSKYVLAVRWIQLFMGLGTVYFCSRASVSVFGEKFGRATVVIGLFFPTLIYVTGEVLTECTGLSIWAGGCLCFICKVQCRESASAPIRSSRALMKVLHP